MDDLRLLKKVNELVETSNNYANMIINLVEVVEILSTQNKINDMRISALENKIKEKE